MSMYCIIIIILLKSLSYVICRSFLIYYLCIPYHILISLPTWCNDVIWSINFNYNNDTIIIIIYSCELIVFNCNLYGIDKLLYSD